jgi:O-antigen ligase
MLFLTLIYFLHLSYNNKVVIPKSTVFLIFLISISILINPNTAYSTFFVFLTCLIISFLFVTTIPFSNYATTFFNVLKFFIVVSFLRYFFIFFDVSTPLPEFVSINGDHFQNFLFFGLNKQVGTFEILRNNGLWWEPGAFQAFINISFIFGLILGKINFKIFMLFFIAIISTFSTTGIIVFAILSIVYYRQLLKKQKKILIFLFLLALPIINFINFYEITINKFSATSENYGSYESRSNDFETASKMFIDHPLIGSGFGNATVLEKYSIGGTGSNGIVLLIANLGILSLLVIIPVLFPKYLFKFNWFEKLLITLSIFFIFFTENFTIILIFSLLLIYGFSNPANKFCLTEDRQATIGNNLESVDYKTQIK